MINRTIKIVLVTIFLVMGFIFIYEFFTSAILPECDTLSGYNEGPNNSSNGWAKICYNMKIFENIL